MKKNNCDGLIYEPFVIVELNKERAIRFNRLSDDLRCFAGEILTIIDASYSEERQNKAIKDLIKTQFRKLIGHYEDICFFGTQGSQINLPE